MKADLVGNPDFGTVEFTLDSGDTILTESGAMAAMDSDVDVQTELMGGMLPAFMRKILAGESLLAGKYTAKRDGRRLMVSPGIPGEVRHINVTTPVWLTAGSFLACSPGITLSPKFGGLRALFSGEGMFYLRVTGSGDLWYNSYGAIVEVDLNEDLVVDTGHVVGWEDGVNWSVEGVGSLFTTLFSGEGLVLRFKPPGKVWLQTRSVGGLVNWLRGYC